LNLTDSLIDYYNTSYIFTNRNLTIDGDNKNFAVCDDLWCSNCTRTSNICDICYFPYGLNNNTC